MTANPPFFDPLFLDIGLTTARAHENTFFIEHPSFFLHTILFFKLAKRIAQGLT
jgi:hypothetical protein